MLHFIKALKFSEHSEALTQDVKTENLDLYDSSDATNYMVLDKLFKLSKSPLLFINKHNHYSLGVAMSTK